MFITPFNQPDNPQAKLRLFCFPFAGGGASVYVPWRRDLTPEIDLRAYQPPGRESRGHEPMRTRLEPVVQEVLADLEPLLDKPFALFGHSLGALVAFEVSRALRRRNISPVHLFVSARRGPHLPDRFPPVSELPEPEFIEAMRHYGGTPEQILQDPELKALFLPILRADFAITDHYRFVSEPPLDCPITAFAGTRDVRVEDSEIDTWRAHTSQGFRLHMVQGDHFFIKAERHLVLPALCEALLADEPASRAL